MKFLIRKGTINDCATVARLVTFAWNETYKGIVPNCILKKLKTNEEESATNLIKNLELNNFYQLVLEVNGKIVGFVNYGKTSDTDFNDCGEIIALYILKDYQGKGLGKKLFENAYFELEKMGFKKIIIACLKGNPANDFYIHMGGKYIKDGIFARLNLKENIYLFEK